MQIAAVTATYLSVCFSYFLHVDQGRWQVRTKLASFQLQSVVNFEFIFYNENLSVTSLKSEATLINTQYSIFGLDKKMIILWFGTISDCSNFIVNVRYLLSPVKHFLHSLLFRAVFISIQALL